MNFLFCRRGQIWVETVIYTLIALAIMGAVLAFVQPKIQEIQDRAIIEQSIEILEHIDQVISEINRGGAGNTRKVEIEIKKGELIFEGNEDSIVFLLEDSKSQYSEPGILIKSGNVEILTEDKIGENEITLTLNYSERYNLQFGGNEEKDSISKAPTPYSILFEHKGIQDNKPNININII